MALSYRVVLDYVDKGLFYLAGKHGNNAVDALSGYKAQCHGIQFFCNAESGKDKALYVTQDVYDVFAVGKVVCFLQIYAAVFFVGFKYLVYCVVY